MLKVAVLALIVSSCYSSSDQRDGHQNADDKHIVDPVELRFRTMWLDAVDGPISSPINAESLQSSYYKDLPLGDADIHHHRVPDFSGHYESRQVTPNIFFVAPVPMSLSWDDGWVDCRDAPTFLFESSANRYSEIPFNPHCTEHFSVDEVNVRVFAFEKLEEPFIELSTGGPACSEWWLYGFRKNSSSYELIDEVCTG